ncbi:MAG: hypothetical protein IKK21_10110 [Clostridia bacterium]|nr:hypothetical protein [Clostridia bacterium]
MLRKCHEQPLYWADHTMSIMQERKLEACADRLNAALPYGLFDLSDDTQVEALWARSYDAQEHPRLFRLHTAESLQQQVLRDLPAELALTSMQEHQLLERLCAMDGKMPLMDLEESRPAESLVKRMWCSLEWKEDRPHLRMPDRLLLSVMRQLEETRHQEVREHIRRFDATLCGLMYIAGFLHYQEPLNRLMNEVLRPARIRCSAGLVKRFFRASYEYTYDDRGDMILLHPGLAQLERIIPTSPMHHAPEVDQALLMGAVMGMLPGEADICLRMAQLLEGAVRPELTPVLAVDDLRMLMKQGVDLDTLREVLATLLSQQPTQAMYDGLRELYIRTPRWGGLPAAVVQ